MKEKKKARVGEREGSKDRSTEIGLDGERDCNTHKYHRKMKEN